MPYTVIIIDNYHLDPDHDFVYNGFPTLELAREFARRWTRDSLEDLRKPRQTKEHLRQQWYMFGEDGVVVEDSYCGSSELDFFINHPATRAERDWEAIKKRAGVKPGDAPPGIIVSGS